MASGFTTAMRNSLLTAQFKTTGRYGALFFGDPGDAGATTDEVPTAGSTGYARTAVTFGDDASSGSIANTVKVEFPVATANWGSPTAITHFALCTGDTEAAEDLLMSGALTASKEIGTGDQLTFAIGAITCSIAAQA